jgi:hypothetical protein
MLFLAIGVLLPSPECGPVDLQAPGQSYLCLGISTLLRRGNPTDVLALVVVDLWGVPYHIHSVLALPLVLVYLYVYLDNARYTEGILYSLQK